MASPPVLRIFWATASQAVALRDVIITFAPWTDSSSAMALPMPFVEPVTTATLPVRSNKLICGLPTFQSFLWQAVACQLIICSRLARPDNKLKTFQSAAKLMSIRSLSELREPLDRSPS